MRRRDAVTPWDFIDLQREELLRGDERALRELRKAYRHSSREARRQLEIFTRRIEESLRKGQNPNPSWIWQQWRWNEIIYQIAREVALFGGSAERIVKGVQIESAHLGLEHSAIRLQVQAPHVTFNLLPREATDIIIAQTNARAPAGMLIRDIAQTTSTGITKKAVEVITNELRTGVATGRNPRHTARVIYDEVGKNLDALTEQRAELIARDQSMRTYRVASNENYVANSDVVKGWVWVAALNMYTCVACLAKHLSVHRLDELMMSHPGCRCTEMPMVDFDKPRLPTGEEWLRAKLKSDPATVVHIMKSDDRLKWWRDGKVTLSDLGEVRKHPVWGDSQQVTPLYRLRQIMEGKLPSTPTVVWAPHEIL